MEQTNMTALVCAFARAVHTAESKVPVFEDPAARALFTDEEFFAVSRSMCEGISFFAPEFHGSSAEALSLITDRFLAPAPLARAAFAERALANAAALGARQYVMLGAGYDTFACRLPAWAEGLKIFELDKAPVLADKQRCLTRAALETPESVCLLPADLAAPDWPEALLRSADFAACARSFCSLLGVVHYLPQAAFEVFLHRLAALLPQGSSLVFDYPTPAGATPGHATSAQKQALLAAGAGTPMQGGYSYEALEALLAACGFLIYEHLDAAEMAQQFFAVHNAAEPQRPLLPPEDTGWCLAVRG